MRRSETCGYDNSFLPFLNHNVLTSSSSRLDMVPHRYCRHSKDYRVQTVAIMHCKTAVDPEYLKKSY